MDRAAPAQEALTDGRYPDPRRMWFIVGGLLLGTFLSAMDTLIVVTALPTIVGNLGGARHIAWIITAYLLASTASAPIYGKLGDLLGRKRLFLLAICIFLVGSTASGVAQSLGQLIGARALQGLGAGGLQSLALAIIGDLAPPRLRARYQGVMALSITVATVVGPLVGGLLVDSISWRWIFFINLPLGALALAVVSRRLPSSPRRTGPVKIDLFGSLLVVSALLCLLLAVTWAGGSGGWTSPSVVSLIGAAIVLTLAFVGQERRAPEPVIPLRLFRGRVFDVVVSGGFLLGFAMFGPWVLMPIFLQVVTGADATTSGLLLLPLVASLSLTSIVCGRLVSRWGRYKVFPVTGMGLAVLGFTLYTTLGVGSSRATAGLFMAVTGVGLGMNMQILVAIVQNAVEYRDLGVATGAVSFFRQLGGSLGTTVALSIFTARFAHNLAHLLPAAARAHLDSNALGGSPAAIRTLPGAVRGPLVEAFARALHTGFAWMVLPAVIGLGVMLLLQEVPLADRLPPPATAVPLAADAPAV